MHALLDRLTRERRWAIILFVAAAAFIVLNSAAGLLGNLASVQKLPIELPILVASVFAGALLGTWLGVSRLPRHRLLQGLAIVLVIAALKLLLT